MDAEETEMGLNAQDANQATNASPPYLRTQSAQFAHNLYLERNELLALFCQVAGLEPFGPDKDPEIARQHIQELCQVLMDYIASGHFGLYERIINGDERRRAVAELAKELYPRVAITTEIALEFNDKYDCGDHCVIGGSLGKDLTRLGEALAERAEIEDRLLEAMTLG